MLSSKSQPPPFIYIKGDRLLKTLETGATIDVRSKDALHVVTCLSLNRMNISFIHRVFASRKEDLMKNIFTQIVINLLSTAIWCTSITLLEMLMR